MSALGRLDAQNSAAMRAAGAVASAAPRHIRAGALLAATLLHAGLMAAVLAFASPSPLVAPEPIVVEIASLPAATPRELSGMQEPSSVPSEREATPAETPPDARLPEPLAEPPEPEAAAEPAVAIEPAPERTVEAPLPPPPPSRPRPQPRQASDAPIVPAAEPPPPSPAPAAAPAEPLRPALAAAPALPTRAAAAPDREYVGRLLAWLARFKDYPRAARVRGIQGQTILRLSIQADGRVEAAVIATSSGHPALDSASIETIRRASPLPAPDGGAVELLVPIVFTLRD